MHQALVLAAAHPLIDIDYTAAIQFALFGVLYWTAKRWLFEPYLRLRERRKLGIEGARSEAERMTAQADAKLVDYEKQLAGARSRANEEGRKVRAEGIAHEKEVTERARAEAQKAIDDATTRMRTETEAARLQLLPQASTLARKIASKLLGREVAVVLLFAFGLLVSGRASAQPEQAGAPASSEAGASNAEAAESADPSRHFNYFNFGYGGKDEYGGMFGDGKMIDNETHAIVDDEEPMSPPFILMLVNFAVFVWILLKYLWPAGKKVAADRHDEIKSALDEAGKLRAAAAKKLAEFETRIKDVDSEIATLVAGIRADAEADKQRILAAAAVQAAQMKHDAELRIAAEIELARAQLTREVAAAASTATEKLVREQANADDQRKLVGNFLQGLGGGN
jgi:F-type H+-transporting ATPase subunit b